MQPKLPIPTEELDGLLDALERIAAVADLISCLDAGQEIGMLHPRTISVVASLIYREATEISRVLDNRPRD
jgi:hypothetical protein